MRRALVALAVAGLGIATGSYSLGVASNDPAFSFAGTSASGRVALLGAGLALLAAGLAFWVWRSGSLFGPLLVAGGFGWFLLEWTGDGVASSLAFTTGLVLYASCPAFVGHAVLAFPGGRLSSRTERIVVAAAYSGSVLVLGLLPALLFDPVGEGCSECARNLLLVGARNPAADHLVRIGVWLGVGWAFALALAVVLKGARSSVAVRRSGWLVLAAGAVYLSLVGAMYAASLRRGFLWNGELERRSWFGQAVALVGIALGARRNERSSSTTRIRAVEAPPSGLAFPAVVSSGCVIWAQFGAPAEAEAPPARLSVSAHPVCAERS